MTRGIRRATAVVAIVAGLVATAACGGASEEEKSVGPDAQESAAVGKADRVIPLPELSPVAEELSVGQSVDVIVDVPDLRWTVSSQDDSVVSAEDRMPEDGPSVIRVEAVGPGSALVVFEAEPDLRVEHEFTVVSAD